MSDKELQNILSSPEPYKTKAEFAQAIKQSYPEYKNVPDNVLADKILEKKPNFKYSITELTHKVPLSEEETSKLPIGTDTKSGILRSETKLESSPVLKLLSGLNPVEIIKTYKESPEESRGVNTAMKGLEVATNIGTGLMGGGLGKGLRINEGVAPITEALGVAGKAGTRLGQAVARPITNIKNIVKSDKFASKIQGEFWAKNAAMNKKFGEILEEANPKTFVSLRGVGDIENPAYLTPQTEKLLNDVGDVATVNEAQTLINKINKYIPNKSYSVSARPQDIANMEVVHNARAALSDAIPELAEFKPEWARNKEVFKKLSKFMTDLDKTESSIRKGLNPNDTKAMKKMIDEYFDPETVRQLGGYEKLYRTIDYIKKAAVPALIGAGATAVYFGVKGK